MSRSFRQKGQRDAKQSVKAEFFQNPGMQHCGGTGSRGIGFRRPGVEGKERNQCAKPNKQQQKNLILRACADPAVRRHRLQCPQIETSQIRRHAAIEQDQPEQENKTSDREVDRNFPRGPESIARTPDADQKKSWNERELMERVEEKEIERSKGADCAAGQEKETGVK